MKHQDKISTFDFIINVLLTIVSRTDTNESDEFINLKCNTGNKLYRRDLYSARQYQSHLNHNVH